MTASREAPVEEIVTPHASLSELPDLLIARQEDSLTLSVCEATTPTEQPAATEAQSTLVDIKTPLLPVENKLKSSISISAPIPKTTFHQVYRATEKTDTEVRNYFFKVNMASSKANAIYMSELEAVCAAFYKLLSPGHTADTYAVYDENNYKGVVSEEISNFKSIAQDPFTDEDLQINYIAEKNQIALFDNFDDEVRLYEKKLEALKRQLKRQDKYEIELRQKLDELQANAAQSPSVKIDNVLVEMLSSTKIKNNIYRERGDVTKKLVDVYQKYQRDYHLTPEELKKYRIVKGLAIGLTSSYIYQEDDLHQNNFTKYGQRIDFDMSLWPILYDFKDNGLVDLAFRKPTKAAFRITLQDITRFPNLMDAKPFYWPTNASQILSETTSSILKNIVSMSTNAYSVQMNKRFQKLEYNRVFEYHKFVTLLKFILPDSVTFKNVSTLHLRQDAIYQGKPLMDLLAQAMGERQQNFKDLLVQSPQFIEFMQRHGSVVCEQILIEFKQRNAFYQQKQLQLTARLTNLQNEVINYEESNAALTINLEQLSKSIQALTQSVTDYSAKGHTVTDSQIDNKTQVCKQKLDELNVKQAMKKEKEKELKEIKAQIEQLRLTKKAYALQEIDLSVVQRTFENICQRISNQAVPPTETQNSRGSSENQPHVMKLQKLYQTQRNGVEMFYQQLKRENSFRSGHVEYATAKEKIVAAMDSYLNPGLTKFGGYFRHQNALANELKVFAKSLQPTSSEPMLQLKAVLDLKLRLEKELEQLKSGEMFETITQLLKDDVWKLPDPENPKYLN